jgi:hypothetical protein
MEDGSLERGLEGGGEAESTLMRRRLRGRMELASEGSRVDGAIRDGRG